jgi:hypothetical protein
MRNGRVADVAQPESGQHSNALQDRRRVEPLDVVDCDEQWRLVRELPEERKHGDGNGSLIWRRAFGGGDEEGDTKRIALRRWKLAQPVDDGCEQVTESRVREPSLGLSGRAGKHEIPVFARARDG